MASSTNNSNSNNSNNTKPKKLNPIQQLIAGGCAGFVESSVCHPLDTIKTRMQLRRQSSAVDAARIRHSLVEPALRLKHSLQEPLERLRHSMMEPNVLVHRANASAAAAVSTGRGGAVYQEPGFAKLNLSAPSTTTTTFIKPASSTAITASLGPLGTARRIVQREGFTALYKGLTAVWTGIIPKMAIRFVSFEQYREWLTAYNHGNANSSITFTAGLGSGLTEAVLVVTPAEVCKIRMQSQYHSLMDPSQKQHRKYTNVVQTAFVIVREEGIGALYKGVVPTMLRQGCNQAVNFTAYQYFKQTLLDLQHKTELSSWQSLLLGGVSGGLGPLVNNPLDVVKTRMQKQVIVPGKTPKYTGLVQACVVIAKDEGVMALWKGITPRLLRIVPGQAITFMTYEFCSAQMHRYGLFQPPTL